MCLFWFDMILISVELSRSLSSARRVCISGLFAHHHRVYIYSHVYFYIGASVAFFFFLGVSVQASVCVGTCATEQRQFWRGDIRDGWITENLLKRDNPSCTLIRHTPWFSNGIFSIISAVTAIPSSHSAQLCSSPRPLSLPTPFLSSLFLLLLPCPWLCTNYEPFRLPW